MPRLRKEARRLNSDFRRYAEEALASCRAAIEERIAALSNRLALLQVSTPEWRGA
jgi:hypothetical protein